MKGLEFPIIGTKVKGLTNKFDLTSPSGRKEYFEAKAGDEIKHIKEFLNEKSFMAFLLGKKNSGKGTYSHLFLEIFGDEKIVLVSVGDIVRETHANWETFKKTKDFEKLKSLYRGYISFDEAVDALWGRTQDKLLPTEFILALLKLKLSKLKGKSVFIDGLPREMDQVSYSLYFRDLAGFTDSRDLFVLIDIPESVIDARMRSRVICPSCHSPRSLMLFATKEVGYDKAAKEFYLKCDNSECAQPGSRMVGKEGDDKGIESIRERLEIDDQLADKIFSLHGIPKVLLRNAVPVAQAKELVDDYEITPEYDYEWDGQKATIKEKRWIVWDDQKRASYSLMPPPVVVSLIRQMVSILHL